MPEIQMIPIKKLKKQVIAAFKEAETTIEIAVQSRRIRNELKGRYLNIPWDSPADGYMTIRWNIKRERFDKITFKAFGKIHKVKL